ncbi:hypothetical protein GA0070609_5018 [Micromonospora echinaurantiaca]|uniref:Uncharacterized protein n=1 Tax=Micromonospora echinaurantiaca TaxID=47857 RepID=A0A1C5JVT8_9ACTN|nr:hypothetical protein [Micromonospora echinaurantiaca]SCG74714.1 hypothetical protein GA0070609_5018 [Micromonospora echinaurantiaca]
MRTFRLALSALVVCVALSACGGQDGGDGTSNPSPTGAQPATSPPDPTPASPSPSPSTRVPDDPVDPTIPDPPLGTKRPGGPTPPPPVGDTTLTGTVTAGVEPNCRLLDGYLLIGGPRDVLAVGAKVSVTGRAQPGMMTTCQQGIPFLVESARRG